MSQYKGYYLTIDTDKNQGGGGLGGGGGGGGEGTKIVYWEISEIDITIKQGAGWG